MGRVCDICGRERPNEQFSGGRRRVQVCKRCTRDIPKAKRRFIEAEIQISELFGQTHISDRNISMLNNFAASPNPKIAELATCVLDVVLPAPKIKRGVGELRRVTGGSYGNNRDKWKKWWDSVETEWGIPKAFTKPWDEQESMY